MNGLSLNDVNLIKVTMIYRPTIVAILIFAVMAIKPLFAQENAAASSLGDHPLMARFPYSTLEEIEIVEDVNYSLVLGSLQRSRQEVVAENSQRLRGDVTKITYQVSQEFTGEEVYRFFSDQIAEKEYIELFSCTGRNCGSSNYWANDIFSNRILYGPERNQYFVALRVGDEPDPQAHISLYIITRANRRLYAYLEIIEDDVSRGVVELDSLDLLESLNTQGSVALPMIVFSNDRELSPATNLDLVLDLLQANRDLEFYLVSHLGGDAPLETLLRRSNTRAEFLRQQLVANGVSGDRLEARGVGPLAPACDIADCADRVELVLK